MKRNFRSIWLSPRLTAVAVLCTAVLLTSCSANSSGTPKAVYGPPTVFQYLYAISAPADVAENSATVFKIGADGSLNSMGTAMQSSTPTLLVASDANNHVFGVTVPPSGLPLILRYSASVWDGTLQQLSSATLNEYFVQAAHNPAGSFLFVSAGSQCYVKAGDNAGFIATYSVDQSDGLALVPGSNTVYLPTAPLSIAVDPKGTYLYAAEMLMRR